mgnify:CR=1 FL=1
MRDEMRDRLAEIEEKLDEIERTEGVRILHAVENRPAAIVPAQDYRGSFF